MMNKVVLGALLLGLAPACLILSPLDEATPDTGYAGRGGTTGTAGSKASGGNTSKGGSGPSSGGSVSSGGSGGSAPVMPHTCSDPNMIDDMEAESHTTNICQSDRTGGWFIYSDGTGYGGKEITGLNAAIPAVATASQTNVYGGIDRGNAIGAFWRTKFDDPNNYSTMLADMNAMWASLVRGMDRPDLIIVDSLAWGEYVGKLQVQQRFSSMGGDGTAGFGFPTVKFMDCDVVLDGGMGGFAAANTAYFLNTKYLHFRPHSARNFVPLSPNKRYSINQDAEVQILGWAGNLTCSGAQFQGRISFGA